MYKDNVLVNQEHIENNDSELQKESNEQTDSPRAVSLLVVVVQLVHVSVLDHPRWVNNHNERKVHYCQETVPQNDLAKEDGKAIDPLVWKVAHKHHKHEHRRVGQGADQGHSHFLVDVPTGVVELHLVPLEGEAGHRGIDKLQDQILAHVVDEHTEPQYS